MAAEAAIGHCAARTPHLSENWGAFTDANHREDTRYDRLWTNLLHDELDVVVVQVDVSVATEPPDLRTASKRHPLSRNPIYRTHIHTYMHTSLFLNTWRILCFKFLDIRSQVSGMYGWPAEHCTVDLMHYSMHNSCQKKGRNLPACTARRRPGPVRICWARCRARASP